MTHLTVMLKLSARCAKMRLLCRLEKKTGKSNEWKPGFFNKGDHRLVFFCFYLWEDLPSAIISRFLAESPGFDNGKVEKSARWKKNFLYSRVDFLGHSDNLSRVKLTYSSVRQAKFRSSRSEMFCIKDIFYWKRDSGIGVVLKFLRIHLFL